MKRRRKSSRVRLFCSICGKSQSPWCSLGHKFRLPARDRRKIQIEE